MHWLNKSVGANRKDQPIVSSAGKPRNSYTANVERCPVVIAIPTITITIAENVRSGRPRRRIRGFVLLIDLAYWCDATRLLIQERAHGFEFAAVNAFRINSSGSPIFRIFAKCAIRAGTVAGNRSRSPSPRLPSRSSPSATRVCGCSRRNSQRHRAAEFPADADHRVALRAPPKA